MAINIILNLLVALIVFAFMFQQQRKHATFTVRVFTGLGLGVLLGAAVQCAVRRRLAHHRGHQ